MSHDLTVTVCLSEADTDRLRHSWLADRHTDVAATVLALLAAHHHALVDAVAELDEQQQWPDEYCPRCGLPVGRPAEHSGGRWWHPSCATQDGWEAVKDRPDHRALPAGWTR